MENFTERKTPAGLYSPRFEHDNCGIGAVVDIKGRKSHKTIDDALQIVEHLEHRAGKDAEGKTGDGVGILLQISHKFFQKAAAEQGLTLGAEREYGIGMFFFPQDELKRNQAKKLFEIVCKKEGLPFLGWREVPTCPEVLGHKAIACMPSIWQGFVGKPPRLDAGIAFDRRLAGHGCNLFLNDLKTSAIAGLLGQFIQHCQEQFPLTASVEIHWYTTEGIFVASESINLKSQLCKSILIGVQNAFLLPCQADNNRRHQTLGHHTLFIKLFHQAFIFYLFMSRMLVNDEQFVFKLDQPVSIKDLADNLMFRFCLWLQKFFFKEIERTRTFATNISPHNGFFFQDNAQQTFEFVQCK